MTETELNEKIGQIEAERCAQLPQAPKRHTGRYYHQKRCVQKNDRLMKIISRRYIPHADIRPLQQILEHESSATTEIYTYIDDLQMKIAVNSNPRSTMFQ